MSLLTRSNIELHVHPREMWTWSEFQSRAPQRSIALDGMVLGGPRFDENQLQVNFDHHDTVVREATMSTAQQVYFAIKGGLMERFKVAHVYINDRDQDTALAVWLLCHHKLFERTSSLPHISRLLALTDRLDITGGAFPMNLDDSLLEEHNWVFGTYTDARTSGRLAQETESEMLEGLEITLGRLDRFMMGEAQRRPLNTAHRIEGALPLRETTLTLYEETGGNSARYYLYNKLDMQAFVARVTTRPDGRHVYAIGRRSRFVPFDVTRALQALSEVDSAPWGGSDIIGGSNRTAGSGLSWEDIRRVFVGW